MQSRESPQEKSSENERSRARTGRSDLTPREIEVARLLVWGRSNKEIAAELHITANTAKAHVGQVLLKLGVRSRTEAALIWSSVQGPHMPRAEDHFLPRKRDG